MIDALQRHHVILLDSCIWIYYIEDHPRYADLIESMLAQCVDRKTRLLTSDLSLLEIKVAPLKQQSVAGAGEYELLLDRFPNLSLLPIDRAVLNRAARLRARYRLRTPDAIILASGLVHGATLAVSNDDDWNKVSGIEHRCLDELAGMNR